MNQAGLRRLERWRHAEASSALVAGEGQISARPVSVVFGGSCEGDR